jgi:hypothetical protein
MEHAKLLKWTIHRTRKTWDAHPGDLKPQHYFVELMEDSTQIVHSLMDPKISSLQKYIVFFTSSSAGNQGSEVPKPYKNQASTAFCTGLKASIFVVKIRTGI